MPASPAGGHAYSRYRWWRGRCRHQSGARDSMAGNPQHPRQQQDNRQSYPPSGASNHARSVPAFGCPAAVNRWSTTLRGFPPGGRGAKSVRRLPGRWAKRAANDRNAVPWRSRSTSRAPNGMLPLHPTGQGSCRSPRESPRLYNSVSHMVGKTRLDDQGRAALRVPAGIRKPFDAGVNGSSGARNFPCSSRSRCGPANRW